MHYWRSNAPRRWARTRLSNWSPTPTAKSKPVFKRWWFWTGVGGAVFLVGVGGALGGVALNANNNWLKNGDTAARDRAMNLSVVADVMMITGAAAAVAVTVAAILVWKRKRKEKASAVRLYPSCGPAGCGVVARGNF